MNKGLISWIIAITVALFAGLTLDGTAAQKQPPQRTAPKEQPKMGGTLVFGLGKGHANLNPFVATSSSTQFVKESSYESLLASDDDGRIVPKLAAAYEVSAGGTVFTLRLRKGVKFHNGKEMKADDVVWSANHVKDPKNGAFGQEMIKDVKSLEKIDDYTVKFTLGSPSATFLFHLGSIRMLPIAPAGSLQTGQIKLAANSFVPGTGPFMFEKAQPGFDTVARKFPEYWGGPAFVDQIIFRPISDTANRFNALRTGDVQMADRISALDAARVKKGDVKGIAMLENPLGGFRHIVFNYDNPLFQRVEMRQALSYAVDKKRFVSEVFFGAAVPAEVMMDPKGMWARAANLPPHKRDLIRAKALLKAAGYNGQELVLLGRKFENEFLEALQRMFREAGINVRLEILEAGVVEERYIQGKYDLCSDGANVSDDPVVTFVPEYYTTKVEKGHYSNPRVDRLLDGLGSEFDEKKRLKMFKELAVIIHDEIATLPLCFEIRYIGMTEKVQGYGSLRGHSFRENQTYFKQVWLK